MHFFRFSFWASCRSFSPGDYTRGCCSFSEGVCLLFFVCSVVMSLQIVVELCSVGHVAKLDLHLFSTKCRRNGCGGAVFEDYFVRFALCS